MYKRIPLGTAVTTPNGPGTFEGVLFDQGTRNPMVRHKISKMTSCAHGRCYTKRAQLSTIFIYDWEDVEVSHG